MHVALARRVLQFCVQVCPWGNVAGDTGHLAGCIQATPQMRSTASSPVQRQWGQPTSAGSPPALLSKQWQLKQGELAAVLLGSCLSCMVEPRQHAMTGNQFVSVWHLSAAPCPAQQHGNNHSTHPENYMRTQARVRREFPPQGEAVCMQCSCAQVWLHSGNET